MKKNALSLALIMIAGSMAGCLADGADGVPEITLSDEDVIAIFDDNFADFVNNSSVTVINEIHYHNNTTTSVVNQNEIHHHNNTTTSVVNQNTDTSTSEISIEGSEGSGMLHVLDIDFEFDDLVNMDDKPDFRSRTFIVAHTYYDAAMNQDVTSEFTVSCGDYYLVGAATGAITTWWDNNNNYWDAWGQAGYNGTYSEILENNGYSKRDYCDEDRWLGLHNGYVTESIELHTLEVPAGHALKCVNDVYTNAGTTSQLRMLTSTDEGETWGQHNPLNYYNTVRISMEEPGSGYSHLCSYTYGNGTAMDYTISVTGIAPNTSYRLVFYYELVPVIGVGSEITYGEWINEFGDASEPWSLSLSDDEWLEVKSAQLRTKYNNVTGSINLETAYICDNNNLAIFNTGHSPMFGGDYQIYPPNFIHDSNELSCALDGASIVSWSIIYRIHNV